IILAFELKDKLTNLDDKTYVEQNLAAIIVHIWKIIDFYLLNEFYKAMVDKDVIKKLTFLDEKAVTDENILNKARELQERSSVDQTVEYIVPVIGVVRKEPEINASDDNVFNESCDYLFYLIFNTKKILEE